MYMYAEYIYIYIYMHIHTREVPSADPTRLSAKSVLCPYWRFVGYQLKLTEDDQKKCLKNGLVDHICVYVCIYICAYICSHIIHI